MSVVIILYSKYSNLCTELFQSIDQTLEYRRLCIDNASVRRLILKRNQYDIQKVPCILVFHANGVMNKYEGQAALEWARETVFQTKHVSPPPPPPSSPTVFFMEEPPPATTTPTTFFHTPTVQEEEKQEEEKTIPYKEEESMDNSPVMKAVKDDKHDSVLTIAQQMQKEREAVDDTLRKN